MSDQEFESRQIRLREAAKLTDLKRIEAIRDQYADLPPLTDDVVSEVVRQRNEDNYKIFKKSHQRRIIKTIASPAVDEIIHNMHSALQDREESQAWFWSSVEELERKAIEEIKSQGHDPGERDVLIKMLELMLDEIRESEIDECFRAVFSPPYDLPGHRKSEDEE